MTTGRIWWPVRGFGPRQAGILQFLCSFFFSGQKFFQPKICHNQKINHADGEKRLFSWHIRMTPGAWRLHFHPLKPTKIIIGYIGVKIQ